MPDPNHYIPTGSFLHLARAARRIEIEKSAENKKKHFGQYILSLNNDSDLTKAIRLFDGSVIVNHRHGIRGLGRIASEFLELDYDNVFEPCRKAAGSVIETIEKLTDNVLSVRGKRQTRVFPLQEIDNLLNTRFNTDSGKGKQDILFYIFRNLTGIEIRYILQILTTGRMQVGLDKKAIQSVLAGIYQVDARRLFYAGMITGSLGKSVILAKNNQLSEAEFRVFNPLAYMHATPVEDFMINETGRFAVEEKFNGLRCQLHSDGNEIKLFSDKLEDITQAYPEITGLYAKQKLRPVVLDGIVCAYNENRILPPCHLNARMKRQKRVHHSTTVFPAIFIACDLLFYGKSLCLNEPLITRRKKLEIFCRTTGIPVSTQYHTVNDRDMEYLYKRAVERGNDGLMIKDTSSVYEFGRQSDAWLTIKKTGASLKTIIMYAHRKNGPENRLLSRFTLGIRVDDDNRYDERFIPIAKIEWDESDRDLIHINEQIRNLTTDRYGSTLGLLPELVVESSFDEIRINRRTKANFVLHRPQPRSVCWNSKPTETNTLKEVEQLYRQQVTRTIKPQGNDPSFQIIE